MSKRSFNACRAMLERGLAVSPIAAQTYSKSHRYLSGTDTPYFIDHAVGSHAWDIDGNEFIDFILGLGPVTVGYNHPEVNEAIARQLEKGIIFSQSSPLEVELAEKLVEVIPCAEMVRFVKNGGDATTAAIRLARAATSRDLVAACGYHGMHDWYIGSTVLTRGIPAAVRDLTKSFTYNDIASLDALFDQADGKIAAVILEPVQGNGPEEDFLQQVRERCNRHGAVLIFDEVVSGFRVALGGAQEYYGVTPDLAAIGKGMANGMALSAVVGKKEILELIAEGVFISTTFAGEALALAAALKTIEILERPESFPYIWKISEELLRASGELMRQKGLEDTISLWGLAPHSGFIFKAHGKLNETEMLSAYQQRLLREGILSVGINNFCLAHSAEDIRTHIRAIDLALDDLKTAIENDSLAGIADDNPIDPIFKRN